VVNPEIAPETFFGVLEFLYTGTMPRDLRNNEVHVSSILSIADNLKITGLRKICTTEGRVVTIVTLIRSL
jgi:hypothetical protein